MLAGMVSQHGIDTIDAILDWWIGAKHADAGVVTIRMTAEEVLQDLPVSAVGRCLAPLASGVTVDLDIQYRGLKLPQHLFDRLHACIRWGIKNLRRGGPLPGPAEKFITGIPRIGICQD
jgi:hypothetical protein